MHKINAITAGAAALGMALALATAQVATAAAPHTSAMAGPKV